jgi:hypothetical protein
MLENGVSKNGVELQFPCLPAPALTEVELLVLLPLPPPSFWESGVIVDVDEERPNVPANGAR